MKLLPFLIFLLASTFELSAQSAARVMIDGTRDPYPPTWTAGGITYYCGYPIKDIVNQTGFIFEGKILTDSVASTADEYGYVATFHKVLLLKEFKGNFPSDTIEVATFASTRKNDEAVFLADGSENIFFQKFAYGSGFIPVCGRIDISKEVYEPIQIAVGHSYIDVHPNSCVVQKPSPNLK